MRYLVIVFLALFPWTFYAQNTSNIARFNENEKVLKEIETQYHVRFFYKKIWLNDIPLKRYSVIDNLDSLLRLTFKNTPIRYYTHQSEYVILTYNEELNPNNLVFSRNAKEEEIIYSKEDDIKLIEQLKFEEKQIKKIGMPGGAPKKIILSGNVADIITDQKIEGVAVYADDGKVGTTTDSEGNYNLTLPQGFHIIHFKHIAMQSLKRQIEIYTAGKVNIRLLQKMNLVEGVSIVSEDERKKRKVVGFETLKLREIEELPTFMGETDVIKQSFLLPGIQSAGEADLTFSVRGGKGDQNLILIEGMHTYNNSHFFGFFPNINPSTISKVNIYKASIPMKYGNRISSVYDIVLKSGEYKDYSIDGSVSPVTGSLAVSGPIIKDKLTFSVAGRSTFSDYVFNRIDLKEFKNSSASFYDFQVKVNYKIESTSSVSLFYYKSYDDFALHLDSTYNFYNELGSINWIYAPNEKISVSSVLGFTNFKNRFRNTSIEDLSSLKEQKINDLKYDLSVSYNLDNKNTIAFGIEALYQQVKPWSLYRYGSTSLVNQKVLNNDKALLNSIFVNENFKYSDKLSFDIGLRYMVYLKFGPNQEFLYQDGKTLEKYIVDTVSYSKNEVSFFDHGLDVRMSGNYNIIRNHNLNFSFNRNNQFIHLLTNSSGATPVDSWQLSNKYICPQIGNQYSIGYNFDFLKSKYFVSVEGYYKVIKNVKDFINGSEFEFNKHPETEITEGKMKTYGIEVLIKKNAGRVSGFVSYTYSRSMIKSYSDLPEKEINNGNYYPSGIDKPHNLSVVLNLKPTRRLTFSNTLNFSSGAPVTLPIAKIYFSNGYSIIYSDRNEYRMPNYFRWDASLTFKGSLKKKRFKSTWTLSVYNITARKNAYSIYYKIDNDNIQGYKLSIIGAAIPTITYKFNY